jgi:hypothetical protein
MVTTGVRDRMNYKSISETFNFVNWIIVLSNSQPLTETRNFLNLLTVKGKEEKPHLSNKEGSENWNWNCHRPTQPQHELELDLIRAESPSGWTKMLSWLCKLKWKLTSSSLSWKSGRVWPNGQLRSLFGPSFGPSFGPFGTSNVCVVRVLKIEKN